MREIELRISILEPVDIVKRKLGAFQCNGTQKILDIYLQHPGMPQLRPVKGELLESFRIRNKGKKTVITWKRDTITDGQNLYTYEEEIEVGSFEGAMALFSSLGFRELVRIENERTTYLSGDYEIVIDEVKGLDPMVEVEHKNPGDRENREVLGKLRAFLVSTGIRPGKELKFNKPELMLQKLASSTPKS